MPWPNCNANADANAVLGRPPLRLRWRPPSLRFTASAQHSLGSMGGGQRAWYLLFCIYFHLPVANHARLPWIARCTRGGANYLMRGVREPLSSEATKNSMKNACGRLASRTSRHAIHIKYPFTARQVMFYPAPRTVRPHQWWKMGLFVNPKPPPRLPRPLPLPPRGLLSPSGIRISFSSAN